MADAKRGGPKADGIKREFSQPEDAASFYSDYTQVAGTAEEFIFQMYETIPGPPGPDGRIKGARARLRATVVMSRGAASRLADIIKVALEKDRTSK